MNKIKYSLKNETEFSGLTHEEVKQWRNPIKLKKFQKQNSTKSQSQNSYFHPYSQSKIPSGQPNSFSVNIPRNSLLNVNAKEFR